MSGVGSRVSPDHLRSFLTQPHVTKAGTPMPDVLAGLNATQKAAAVESLVHYLVSLGGPMDAAPMMGHDGMAMDHGPADTAPPIAPASITMMPCCTLVATALGPVTVPKALAALADSVLASALEIPADRAYGIAADESPPERSTPLYIAHGRFLI